VSHSGTPVSPVLDGDPEDLAELFVALASRFVVASGFAHAAIRSTNSTVDSNASFAK
jgi:hypothetical protein